MTGKTAFPEDHGMKIATALVAMQGAAGLFVPEGILKAADDHVLVMEYDEVRHGLRLKVKRK